MTAVSFWILLDQETMGWHWHQPDHMQSFAPLSRQTTMRVPHHSVFTGRMPLLLPNQQRQSTEGTTLSHSIRQDTGQCTLLYTKWVAIPNKIFYSLRAMYGTVWRYMQHLKIIASQVLAILYNSAASVLLHYIMT